MMRFASIDFETANEKRHSPCAVGIVVADEQEIVDEYYGLINPMMGFRSFNTHVHGITSQDVANAPSFAEVWPTIKAYVTEHITVAHNASFDMSVIRNTLDYFQMAYPEMEYLCTANISRKAWPNLSNHKLNTVAAYHGITFEHHHALEDARVAANVFQHALRQSGGTLDALLAHWQMQKGRIFDHGYTTPKAKRTKKQWQPIYF